MFFDHDVFFTQIEFFPYTDHGDAFWDDGEYLARKVDSKQLTKIL